MPSGLQVLPYGQAADSDCFVVTRATARKYGLTTLADLAKQNGKLVIGAAPEVKKRRVGAIGLKDVYGVEFKEFKSLDSDGPLVKGALKKGDVDVANLFTTDTDIAANDWVVPADPRTSSPASTSSRSSPTARPTTRSARPSPSSATSSPPNSSPSSTARSTTTRRTPRTWRTPTRSSTGWPDRGDQGAVSHGR